MIQNDTPTDVPFAELEDLVLSDESDESSSNYEKKLNQARHRSSTTWKKGQSGNPKGKPKGAVTKGGLSLELRKSYGTDGKKALEALLQTATDRREVHQIAKDLLPYQQPKLASLETRNTNYDIVEVRWLGEAEPKKKVINHDDIVPEVKRPRGRPKGTVKYTPPEVLQALDNLDLVLPPELVKLKVKTPDDDQNQ